MNFFPVIQYYLWSQDRQIWSVVISSHFATFRYSLTIANLGCSCVSWAENRYSCYYYWSMWPWALNLVRPCLKLYVIRGLKSWHLPKLTHKILICFSLLTNSFNTFFRGLFLTFLLWSFLLQIPAFFFFFFFSFKDVDLKERKMINIIFLYVYI